MDRSELLTLLLEEPIRNSHSHHMKDQEQHELNLEVVLRNSYVSWCGKPVPAAGSEEEIAIWLNAVRTRSYFVWLEKALMELYHLDEPLDFRTWDQYDRAIRTAHQDPTWHLQLLRNNCRYQSIMQDAYWLPGSDNGHPDLFKPVYRINSFFYGYNRSAVDHNGNNIQQLHEREIYKIDDYLNFIGQILEEKKRAGCTAFKCALAYDRSLAFGEATKEQAQKAMQRHANEQDIRLFQDYIMQFACNMAADLGMPMQIHTGLGLMIDSSAMQLQPLIARNQRTTFLLMHGSYPWTSDIAGLTHVYDNVWVDLCWLPLISTAAAQRLMHELIDVCDADRVIWGCDAWTSEESYGARMAFLDGLSRVLSERMDAGLMREPDALRYASALMHDNLARLTGV